MDAALKTVAYLRVSTRSQDLANQELAILEFSQKRRFPIDQFIESRISSRHSPLQRRIDEMLGTLEPGDRLLVSELSRLGQPKRRRRGSPWGPTCAAGRRLGEGACLPSEILHGFGGVLRLRGVHANEPDGVALPLNPNVNRIAVNHPLAAGRFPGKSPVEA